ncbi:MAG: DUF445 family protein [Candidatus Schekmanbacteria bacterium]|nr:DUF445 family protein [Candidatus Schekmanbacteria bacterium]
MASLTSMLTSPVFLSYASIPVTCGFIGWFTNWVALKMTFYPLSFFGIPPYLGWQGVIPRKAPKIAGTSVDLITSRLITKKEVFDRIDPVRLSAELAPIFDMITEDIVADIVTKQSPTLWEMMPRTLKNQIIRQVKEEVPTVMSSVFKEYRENIDDLFDLKGLVLHNLTGPNVQLLNEMFQRCGEAEFKFIERSGLYIGFVMGLAQCVVWYFFARWWLLPIIGVIVGYITNWVALKMIFEPLYPTKYWFFTYQGLFLKRQAEVSKEYADIVANRIMVPSKVIDMMIRGNRAEAFFEIVQRHVKRAIDSKAHLFKGVILFTIGTKQYRELKDYACQRIIDTIPKYSQRAEAYWKEAMDVENTLYTRLKELPAPDFEDILHSCFKEDEFILILVGAALGLMVGLFQGLYVVV